MIPLPKLSTTYDVPKVVAAVVAWAQLVVKSVLEPHRPRVVTESCTLYAGESVRVTGDVTVTLPPAGRSQGRDVLIYCDGECTVAAPGGEAIIGAEATVSSFTSTWRFESDGRDWMVRA